MLSTPTAQSRSSCLLYSLVVSAVLSASQSAWGQALLAPVSKTQALKSAKIQAAPGWHEAISDIGRFRILFPGQSKSGSERGVDMRGFKFFEQGTNWFAYYSDFDPPRPSDDEFLRIRYQGSVEALTRNGNRLLSQRYIRLHGRLGTEFVLETADTVSYMRAFLYVSRMYTLAVDRKRVADGDATVPQDVQQFFESFTYWDIP